MFEFTKDAIQFFIQSVLVLCFGSAFLLPMLSGNTEEIPILLTIEFAWFVPGFVLSVLLMIFGINFFRSIIWVLILMNVYVGYYHYSGHALIAAQQTEVAVAATSKQLSDESEEWQRIHNNKNTSRVYAQPIEQSHYDNVYTQQEDCSEGCGEQSF
jgi:hypothetical protein